MLHPRPRTVWSRWIEGFEALRLERTFSKPDILEFYLNQVPYKANRRGIVQAANYYFDRDISTLSAKEMLALAVLVRSPQWFDPRTRPGRLERAVNDLADRLGLAAQQRERIASSELQLQGNRLAGDLSHFLRQVDARQSARDFNDGMIHTTIDLDLQQTVQRLLDARLDKLRGRQAHNAAALVVDHRDNEILAWTIGYAGREDRPFNRIDAVLARRQPGSALKPLLYSLALEQGWTAATMLDDSPLEESVGPGMHVYHNYSRDHYGPIALREALGNSLNIPAVLAIQQVGPENFLAFLHRLGVSSLSGHPNVYGDGLALGNGELSLYELVQAYSVLARMGSFKALSCLAGEAPENRENQVFDADLASLIADILSDPGAREKEFGRDSILNFPEQTAVKTGTSSDYRDALAIGYNDRYTVGVWIGNLDYTPMNEITGSSGPGLVLRAIFNELNRGREVRPLYFSDRLVKQRVCIADGLPADGDCEARDEWFLPGTRPTGAVGKEPVVRIRKPGPGLLLAMDPRIPDEAEYFEFALNRGEDVAAVTWYINARPVATTAQPTWQWKLGKGGVPRPRRSHPAGWCRAGDDRGGAVPSQLVFIRKRPFSAVAVSIFGLACAA